MENTLLYAFTVFMGFFAIMNPIANVPIFLSLTNDIDEDTVAAVALRSLIIAFIIVVVFSVAGKVIFELFGLTLPALRIAGGLLVFLIGFHMVQGKHSSLNHPKEKEEDKQKSREAALDVAVSPLATPILAGPGTIATAMSFSASSHLRDVFITVVMFGILCVITYILFVFGERFVRHIGASALGAITRMMGLILAVIGTQMVIVGLKGAFDILA
jgi:multiple antibiotic resistance protein